MSSTGTPILAWPSPARGGLPSITAGLLAGVPVVELMRGSPGARGARGGVVTGL